MRLLTCLLLILAIAAKAHAAPKNVVLFVTDDQGAIAGCYGDPLIKTPHMDALAASGTRFSHAFATVASCSPSRSVLLTGLHNHASGQYGLQHSVHNFGVMAKVQSLPVLLSAAGYRTCSIGKLHVMPAENFRFDTFANDKIQGGRNPVQMAENARQFITADDARPFFLYFCPTDPHRAKTGFANDQEHAGIAPVKYDPEQMQPPGYLPNQPEVRQEWAEYYEAISRVDQGLGRLMRVLADTGHADDTLVIFLSDNGPPFPGAKTTLYEPGIRLPLLIRSPDQSEAGAVSDAMVSWSDIAPTILDFAGAKPPAYALHGRSLLPLLKDPVAAGWDQIFASHTFHEVTMYYPMRAIRTPRYKLIMNLAHPLPFPFASDLYESPTWQGVLKRGDQRYGQRATADYIHRPRFELYDLTADPSETHNLSADPQHAATLADLQARLRAWQEKTADPWVVKYTYE